MSDNLAEYSRHYFPQQQARIAFVGDKGPSPEVHARVTVLTRDLLELELEDDRLPEHISVAIGDILEIRSGIGGKGFRCRSLLISGTEDRYLLVRLVGNIIYEELREFFRIDTFIPLRYSPKPHWDFKAIRLQWLELQERRAATAQNPASFIYQGEQSDNPVIQDSIALLTLQYEPPVAANISGGGLRAMIPDRIEPGTYAILELYLPGISPRIIEVAGEVLTSEKESKSGEPLEYSTAFKFVCIEERDRDALISYILRVQQKQIQQMTEEMPALKRTIEEISTQKAASRTPPLYRNILLGVTILFSLAIIALMVNHYRNPGKGVVQMIFDEGLRKYLEKQNPRP